MRTVPTPIVSSNLGLTPPIPGTDPHYLFTLRHLPGVSGSLAALCADETVRIIDSSRLCSTAALKRSSQNQGTEVTRVIQTGHHGVSALECMTRGERGDIIITVGREGTIKVWDLRKAGEALVLRDGE